MHKKRTDASYRLTLVNLKYDGIVTNLLQRVNFINNNYGGQRIQETEFYKSLSYIIIIYKNK